MRKFDADGKQWIAQIHDGLDPNAKVEVRGGWEVIQFDTQPGGTVQRITYRPSGWLQNASIAELIEALKEGDTVRAAWSANS